VLFVSDFVSPPPDFSLDFSAGFEAPDVSADPLDFSPDPELFLEEDE
jgi:hypothetical protein